MLSLDHITLSYGERILFDDVSFLINPHDRIGLVGANGTGKSTLLKIIAGLTQSDDGTISKANYVTVGYLPQDGVIASGKTLYKEVETAFENIVEIQNELDEAQQQLAKLDPNSAEHAEVLEVYGELQHKLEDLDAFRMKSKIERVLMGLGFSVPDLQRDCDEFSGGWQMRIALAKLLLREPSVLLLDEPTNHLDIDSLQWLEEYLRQYNGAIILVSHDRTFLDTLTTRTLALRFGQLEVYAGNYSFFEREKDVRRELQANTAKNQQRYIEQQQKFIERFRYKATKARQVQSRIKLLEKIDLVELEGEEEEIHFHFPKPQPSGVVPMELKKINKSYGNKNIFQGLDYVLERGDRIAIVGPNGAGKSTFVRIIAGIEPFEKGERGIGHNVILSYFAQHQAEELDLNKEALEVVEEVADAETRPKLRSILGSFLFHGDDVFKKVKVLSGGEKSRLALAKMLLQPANVIIMDEPTNHLDMKSKRVLQEALQEYEGTFLIVSHDRSFLDPLVTKVVEFTPGKVRTFLGNVSEYLEKKRLEREATVTPSDRSSSAPTKPAVSDKERKRIEAEKRQQLYTKLKPYKEKLEKIEREIEAAEKRKIDIEEMMAGPEFYKSGEQAKEITSEYKSLKEKLNDLYFSWGKVSEDLEALQHEVDAKPT